MIKIILILICFVQISLAWNLSEIRNEIRDDINDTRKTVWTDAQLNEKINYTIIDMIKKSRCLQSTTYYTLYINTYTYTLPSDCLEIDRVAIYNSTGVYRVLDRKTLMGLDTELGVFWMQQQKTTGQPSKYYTYGNEIGIIPAANSTYAGDKLLIYYVIKPSSISADSDIPFNDYKWLYPYHELIVFKVDEMCKRREKAYGEVQMYRAFYLDGIRVMIDEINRKQDYFPKFELQVIK